jgi:hypothetical protein
VGDRLHHDEPLGAARRALDQRGEHLRPLRGPDGERLVDDRQPRRGQRGPLDAARQQDLVLGVVPGAHQVTGAQQLGRRVVAHRGLAYEQATQDQQPDRPRAAVDGLRVRPAAAWQFDRARVQPLRRLPRAALIEPANQLGVGL